MPSDNIAEIPAGRELDAVVAEQVCGWTGVYWLDRETPVGSHKPAPAQRVSNYSTDIAAAWLVVERMRLQGWHYSIDSHGAVTGNTSCGFTRGTGVDQPMEAFGAEADTAPLAICRAALLAVQGKEVGNG